MSAAVVAAPTPRVPRLRRALVFSSAGTAVARATGAVGGLLAARLLGPAGRGQLAILVLFASCVALLAAAGIQFWIARRVAQDGGIGSVRWIARVHVAVAVAVVALGGAVLGLPVAWIAHVGPGAVAAATLFGATAAITLVLLALPNGMRHMGVVAVATVAAAVVYTLAVGGLLVVPFESIVAVLIGGSVGNLLAIGIVLAWSRRAPDGSRPLVRGASEYWRAVRFGVPAGLGEVVLLAMFRVDVLILACFLPLRDVGLYAVATALTEVLWVVPDGIAQVVLPTTARDPEAARTGLLLAIAIATTAIAGAVLAGVSQPLLDWAFGPSFEDASAAVPWLVAAAVAGGAWKVMASDVVARGFSAPRLTSALVGLGVMVSADLVAVPLMGIAGAGLGSALGYGAALATIWRSRSRAMELRAFEETPSAVVVAGDPLCEVMA